jgi:NADPH2:quinone reductase
MVHQRSQNAGWGWGERAGDLMQAWRVVRYGTPTEALTLEETEAPTPGPGLLRVRVHTSVCNRNEIDGCEGTYRTVDPPLPYTLGMEVVGTIDAVGPPLAGDGSLEPWLGRRVMASAVGAFGGHAQYVLVEPDMTFVVPEMLDDVGAAAFFYPFHVAWLSLFERGRLQAGEWLLVHSGAGGVGSAAIQLGVAAGARVIATAGSPSKVDFCRSLGAEVVIDYRADDFVPAVLHATDGVGVDVVCDLVGGETTRRTFAVNATGARHVLAGFSGGIEDEDEAGLVPRPLLFGNFSLGGVLLSYRRDPMVVRRARGLNCLSRAVGDRVQAELVALLETGRIRPIVSRVVSYTELPGELDRMKDRQTIGRTVLDWRALESGTLR